MELIIANKSSGQMWNVANSAQEISWETNRTGSPGTLKFTLIKAGDISFSEGDVVRFRWTVSCNFTAGCSPR